MLEVLGMFSLLLPFVQYGVKQTETLLEFIFSEMKAQTNLEDMQTVLKRKQLQKISRQISEQMQAYLEAQRTSQSQNFHRFASFSSSKVIGTSPVSKDRSATWDQKNPNRSNGLLIIYNHDYIISSTTEGRKFHKKIIYKAYRNEACVLWSDAYAWTAPECH